MRGCRRTRKRLRFCVLREYDTSEAGVERLFSKEGFIHSSYRNSLGRGILLALVRSCMNRHALDDDELRVHQSEESDNDKNECTSQPHSTASINTESSFVNAACIVGFRF